MLFVFDFWLAINKDITKCDLYDFNSFWILETIST